jgi:hypothetical protein
MPAEVVPTFRRRRLIRFSLRTALLVMTLVCIVLGRYITKVRDEQRATNIIKGWGGTVVLDYQFKVDSPPVLRGDLPALFTSKKSANSLPPSPRFQRLRNLVGDHYFSNVVSVTLPYHSNANVDVNVLKAFGRLRLLNLSGTRTEDNDLRKLASLSTLKELYLQDTNITDDGIEWLTKLRRLRRLSLRGTVVSDAGIKKLTEHHSLRYIDIGDTHVSTDGARQLQAALPNCSITFDRPMTCPCVQQAATGFVGELRLSDLQN